MAEIQNREMWIYLVEHYKDHARFVLHATPK